MTFFELYNYLSSEDREQLRVVFGYLNEFYVEIIKRETEASKVIKAVYNLRLNGGTEGLFAILGESPTQDVKDIFRLSGITFPLMLTIPIAVLVVYVYGKQPFRKNIDTAIEFYAFNCALSESDGFGVGKKFLSALPNKLAPEWVDDIITVCQEYALLLPWLDYNDTLCLLQGKEPPCVAYYKQGIDNPGDGAAPDWWVQRKTFPAHQYSASRLLLKKICKAKK